MSRLNFRISMALFFLFLATPGFAKGSKKPKPEPRALKKLIEIDRIKAKPITRNGEPLFDLEQAVNAQAYTAALTIGKFTVKTRQGQTVLLDQQTAGLKAVVAQNDGLVLSDEESCLANIPLLRFSGEVLDLELISATGAKLGFSPKLGFDVGFEGSFDVKRTQMTAVYLASDATNKRILHSVTRGDSIKEKSGSARISFLDLFSLGFDHYQRTPIARVVQQNLNNGFFEIAKATESLVWEAPIMVSDGPFISINAGFDAGIKKGDRFKVQNRTHFWAGAPCQSEYYGSRADVDDTAVVEIYDVQTTHSWAQVTEWKKPEAKILPGARVQVQQLVP